LTNLRSGSRKVAAAEEARAKFASDIHPSSTIVPVQLDISDDTSVKNAHAFIAKYLQEKNIPGLDVLVNKSVHFPNMLRRFLLTSIQRSARRPHLGGNLCSECFRHRQDNGRNPAPPQERRRDPQHLVWSWIHVTLVTATSNFSDSLFVLQLEQSCSELPYGTMGRCRRGEEIGDPRRVHMPWYVR
jgi:NAD(P)-dependent dehydrogenase (short-subunit alcohol dehydrogenase family)